MSSGRCSRELVTAVTAFSRRRGGHSKTLQLFLQFNSQNPSHRILAYLLPNLLLSCANSRDLQTARQVHAVLLRRFPWPPDSFVITALVGAYSKCGRVDLGRRLFDEMPNRDVVAWNAMVSGYVLCGNVDAALGLVGEMGAAGVPPDLITWNSVISGFGNKGDVAMALALFRGLNGRRIEPDVVSWTSVISGLVRSLRFAEAFVLFKEMMASGVRPNSVTLSCLLPACANAADLRFGREIHGYIVVTGAEADLYAASSLVDMYAKCGVLSDAEKLFGRMSEKSVATYNVMIFGYTNHGHCERAMELFDLMVVKGEDMPDHLTFTAVLMTCAHAGWVELGKNLFHLMQRKYGIIPRLEHYACMVDLLGRVGEVLEAYECIKQMPLVPDSFVWGALLGACKTHGNVELAQMAASHLFALEPKSAGSPVLLSNTFMDFGKWEEAARLKKMVKKKKLKTSVGCSWLETSVVDCRRSMQILPMLYSCQKISPSNL